VFRSLKRTPRCLHGWRFLHQWASLFAPDRELPHQFEERKRILAKLLNHPREGIAFNEHYTGDGAIIFKHACALGCEGIVSKRLGSPYRSGRTDHWLKVKNPAAPAVAREAEEEWAARSSASAVIRAAVASMIRLFSSA
jgi:ATP-dependent DNA ligase